MPMTSELRRALIGERRARSAREREAEMLADPARVDHYIGLTPTQITRRPGLVVVQQTFDGTRTRYALVHAEKLPPLTPFRAVAKRTKTLYEDRRFRGGLTGLAIDGTVLGSRLREVFEDTGLGDVYGHWEIVEGDYYEGRVSMRDLVALLQSLMQEGRFEIADGLPDLGGVLGEMKALAVHVHDAGHARYDAGSHTRILAAALACWHAEWFRGPMRGY